MKNSLRNCRTTIGAEEKFYSQDWIRRFSELESDNYFLIKLKKEFSRFLWHFYKS